jgi:uncharacterized repeat protein (TIGR01451 family)
MKTFFAALKRSPKLAAFVAVLVGVLIVPAALLAWGPDRPTYTMAHPADKVVLNSITDNPRHGDERNFVQIREAGTGTYVEDINLVPGKEYEVYSFYHNNASSVLNDEAHNFAGVAQNAKMRVQVPADVKAGQKARFTTELSASNATPQSVWDEAYGSAAQDIALRYVQGSAKITSLGAVNGQTLPDSLFTTGTPIGFDALNGVLPGCTHFEGYVIYRIKAVAPDFEVTKDVSLAGKGAYSESVNVKAGDKVDFRIKYKNVGTTQQDNVIIKDNLPKGLTYVPGTTFVSNKNTNNQWSKVDSDEVVKGGINVGSYTTGGASYVKFTAVAEGVCGANTIVNRATANTANGSKEDFASVVVNKACNPNIPELPQTGIEEGVVTIAGLGAITAGMAYAVRSDRFRNLLRR